MEIKTRDILLCSFYFSNFQQTKNRPVLILKDNLPFDDFIAIPISSKIEKLNNDEFIISSDDFSLGNIPQKSKLILRKTFVVSKKNVIKKYGCLTNNKFKEIKKKFCLYFDCSN